MRLRSAAGAAAITLTVATAPLAGQQVPAKQPPTPPDTQPDKPPATLPDRPAPDLGGILARKIELAHGMPVWTRRHAVEADLEVTFGGRTMIEGHMVYEMHGGRVRLDLDEGTTLLFDGKRAWISPGSKEIPMARFHLLTWPYFLAAPFKLRDPGSALEAAGLKPFRSKLCESAKLTFEAGTGDSPDDWYMVYADPMTNRLLAMAYIVTYGDKPVSEAEKEPHAILYDGYMDVGGVQLATRWSFYDWSEERGAAGDPIGTAKLENVRFLLPDDETFKKPEDASEAKKGG